MEIHKLTFPWKTNDPFLFCAYHDDNYPIANKHMGPFYSLAGRNLGNDFDFKNKWRMYHGKKIPGFPCHPHRGFETITIVEKGYVDHADSFGGSGRYGNGDLQWMTAGSGIQHSEMFPLLDTKKNNFLEMFQVWLNLSSKNKMVDSFYKMIWKEEINSHKLTDEKGKETELIQYFGDYNRKKSLIAPPNSWAFGKNNNVAIWILKISPHAIWTLPECLDGVIRTLYFYEGESINILNQDIQVGNSIKFKHYKNIKIKNHNEFSKILLLQGKPINEPIIQYGPFVMNTEKEIYNTFEEFNDTKFGGWPWEESDYVNPRNFNRYAKYKNGKIENP